MPQPRSFAAFCAVCVHTQGAAITAVPSTGHCHATVASHQGQARQHAACPALGSSLVYRLLVNVNPGACWPSLTMAETSLNLGCLASAMSWKSTDSLVSMHAPAVPIR